MLQPPGNNGSGWGGIMADGWLGAILTASSHSAEGVRRKNNLRRKSVFVIVVEKFFCPAHSFFKRFPFFIQPITNVKKPLVWIFFCLSLLVSRWGNCTSRQSKGSPLLFVRWNSSQMCLWLEFISNVSGGGCCWSITLALSRVPCCTPQCWKNVRRWALAVCGRGIEEQVCCRTVHGFVSGKRQCLKTSGGASYSALNLTTPKRTHKWTCIGVALCNS